MNVFMDIKRICGPLRGMQRLGRVSHEWERDSFVHECYLLCYDVGVD